MTGRAGCNKPTPRCEGRRQHDPGKSGLRHGARLLPVAPALSRYVELILAGMAIRARRPANLCCMRPATSLYLDLVRALAAFTVFMGHASGQFFTAGLLWQTGLYDQTAVMVFFVLSGFVI